ncbi:hypothetical protein R6Q59_013500 [Mikania micrantha]
MVVGGNEGGWLAVGGNGGGWLAVGGNGGGWRRWRWVVVGDNGGGWWLPWWVVAFAVGDSVGGGWWWLAVEIGGWQCRCRWGWLSNDCVTRRFIFPNTKILALKHKVSAMSAQSGQHILNPTRVEVVTWLLYKCAVRAAISNNLGSFYPIYIRLATNLRDKIIEPLPENSLGNFLMGIEVQTMNQKELNPEVLIGQLRNQKNKIYGTKNIEAAFRPLLTTFQIFIQKTSVKENLRILMFFQVYVGFLQI